MSVRAVVSGTRIPASRNSARATSCRVQSPAGERIAVMTSEVRSATAHAVGHSIRQRSMRRNIIASGASTSSASAGSGRPVYAVVSSRLRSSRSSTTPSGPITTGASRPASLSTSNRWNHAATDTGPPLTNQSSPCSSVMPVSKARTSDDAASGSDIASRTMPDPSASTSASRATNGGAATQRSSVLLTETSPGD